MPATVPSTKTPNVDDGDIRAIAKVGDTMVIGGNFTSVAGQSRSRLATFSASTGALGSLNLPVNGEVSAVVPGPVAGTVFVGGDFTQIGTTAVNDLGLVNLNTGTVVTTFKAPVFSWGEVNDAVYRGGRLYITGTFTKIGTRAKNGVAAINPTTGALDNFVDVQLTGHHNDSGGGAQGALGGWDLDVTPDGRTMVVAGNFKYADGQLRDQVVQIDLTGAAAAVKADWATNRYSPYCFNWAFDSYVRGVAYSLDGSYFVVTSTGGGVAGTLCDAVARFETNASSLDAQPTWVNESGGDTTWGVTITDNVVYVGGHQRWANNPTASDYAGPGAVPRPGLVALEPTTGRPLKWNPGRNPPGKAVYAMLATSDGLYIGSNTDFTGNFNYRRGKIALFPYAGGSTLASTETSQLPGNVYVAGGTGGAASNVLYRVNAGGGAIQSLDSGPDWMDDSQWSFPYRNDGTNAAGWDSNRTVDATVPASTPGNVFDSERWSPSDNPAMNWAFPAQSGVPLTVRLYFANRCDCTSQAGQRAFDVSIDGSTVLDDFDIVAAVGHAKGTMRSFDITSDGTVNIDFSHVNENPLVNGIEIIRRDLPAPSTSSDVLGRVNLTTSGASGAATPVNGTGVEWGTTRGAFLVGGQLFYGQTDGYLYKRSFNGTTFGAAQQIDPYHDAFWKDISDNQGGKFDGNVPTLYGQFPNVTGMTYQDGRLYYTLFNDSRLFWRWFSPDSGIMDETTFTVPSSMNFANANGMFVSGGKLYVADRSTGNLQSIAFSPSGVTGSATTVSGPATDGINWKNRSLFLRGAPVNQPPTASFTASCTNLTCSFNATASSDPDGSVVSYAWNFGDTATGTGATTSRTYAAAGTYNVTLTVTDNAGDTSTRTEVVTATAPPANQAPTANFTSSCAPGTCSFTSTSSDPDGSITGYAWTFGDGGTSTAQNPSHAYAGTGPYTVTLTVTDNQSATGTVTKSVTVPAAPAANVSFVGSAHSAPGAAKFKAATVPATVQAGDTLLLFLSTPTAATWSAPTGVIGWTQVDTATNGTIKSTVWRKTAAAGDAGTAVRVDDPSAFRLGALTVAAYRGANGSAALTVGQSGDSGTANHVSPTIAVTANQYVVSYWTDKSATTSAWGAPASTTQRDVVADGTGATRFSVLLADSNGPVSAGSYGGLTATSNAASDKAIAWTIALTPAP